MKTIISNGSSFHCRTDFNALYNNEQSSIASVKKILLYTDGACSGNPGPGGYGIILKFGDHEKELSGGFADTTNNRMELMGVIMGLEQLKEPCDVTLVSDSRYIIDALEKGWAAKWRANRWMRNKKDKALNPDLWARLLDLCSKHTVTCNWVNGHAGHVENERCDELAVAAAHKPGLPKDMRS
jgi:ribonuclease HI